MYQVLFCVVVTTLPLVAFCAYVRRWRRSHRCSYLGCGRKIVNTIPVGGPALDMQVCLLGHQTPIFPR
jgi:hypothetical protein